MSTAMLAQYLRHPFGSAQVGRVSASQNARASHTGRSISDKALGSDVPRVARSNGTADIRAVDCRTHPRLGDPGSTEAMLASRTGV